MVQIWFVMGLSLARRYKETSVDDEGNDDPHFHYR